MFISDKSEFVEFDRDCMCVPRADFHALCIEMRSSMPLCKTKCAPATFRSRNSRLNESCLISCTFTLCAYSYGRFLKKLSVAYFIISFSINHGCFPIIFPIFMITYLEKWKEPGRQETLLFRQKCISVFPLTSTSQGPAFVFQGPAWSLSHFSSTCLTPPQAGPSLTLYHMLSANLTNPQQLPNQLHRELGTAGPPSFFLDLSLVPNPLTTVLFW